MASNIPRRLARPEVKAFFDEAGSKAHQMGLSDEELDQQLAVLKLVIEYLSARRDAALVVAGLALDLSTFQGYKDARVARTT